MLKIRVYAQTLYWIKDFKDLTLFLTAEQAFKKLYLYFFLLTIFGASRLTKTSLYKAQH